MVRQQDYRGVEVSLSLLTPIHGLKQIKLNGNECNINNSKTAIQPKVTNSNSGVTHSNLSSNLSTTKDFEKSGIRNWRDCSVAKNAYFCSRGLKFCSQYPHGGGDSKPFNSSSKEYDFLFWPSRITAHICSYTHMHTNKNKIKILMKDQNSSEYTGCCFLET